jgi:hypothetical protein
MKVQTFNKATAAAISTAVTGVLLAFFPGFEQEVAAIGVLLTTGLVYFIPNKDK